MEVWQEPERFVASLDKGQAQTEFIISDVRVAINPAKANPAKTQQCSE